MAWMAAVLAELVNIRAFIGKPSAGAVLPQYTSEQVVTDNEALNVAISNLDAQSNVSTTQLGVTGGNTVTLESLLVDTFLSVTWLVYLQETATQDTTVLEIMVVHDGNSGNDAATIKHTEKRIRLGVVDGANIDVVLTGTGASQAMELQATATNDFDARAMRHGYVRG